MNEITGAGGVAVADGDSVRRGGRRRPRQEGPRRLRRVDIVVNNAGILRDKPFKNMTPDVWRPRSSPLHLQPAASFLVRAAWEHMRDQNYGRIVVTSSPGGLFGNFGQANYGAAKMGLVGLTNTLAQEGAKYDIKANAIAPIAATRMTQDILPPEVFEKLTPDTWPRSWPTCAPRNCLTPDRCSSSVAARCSAPRCSRTTA